MSVSAGQLARLIRSKNAGPFNITFDLMFEEEEAFEDVVASGAVTPTWVASTYGVEESDVQVHVYRPGLAIKVTIPRRYPSGDPRDGDVFGCQQYEPFSELAIGKETE
jgi:hypothetical protein